MIQNIINEEGGGKREQLSPVFRIPCVPSPEEQKLLQDLKWGQFAVGGIEISLVLRLKMYPAITGRSAQFRGLPCLPGGQTAALQEASGDYPIRPKTKMP
jgi:hypothetical protein